MALDHTDVVRVVGARGTTVPLVRLFRSAASPALLSRSQVTRSLCPVDDSGRVGAALKQVLAVVAAERAEGGGDDDDGTWAAGCETVRAAAAAAAACRR